MGREEIVKYFKGWESDVQEVLKVIDTSISPRMCHAYQCQQYVDGGILWAIHVTGKLPTYIDGRVALVGDAVSPQAVDV